MKAKCPGCNRVFKSRQGLGMHFFHNHRRGIDCAQRVKAHDCNEHGKCPYCFQQTCHGKCGGAGLQSVLASMHFDCDCMGCRPP